MLLRINRPLLCGMILGREGGLPAIMVEDIIDVARAAGRVIMDVYSTDPKTWDSRSKSDDTPVTKADVMSDDVIRKRLLSAYPEIPIISEEAEHLSFEERRDYKYCWVVDPLDGTKEFINRTGDFAVMIGLSLRGKAVLGVIHAPARETPKTYYAVAGKGAYVLRGGDDQSGKGLGDSERISARPFRTQDPGLRLAVSSSRPPETFIAACDSPVTCSIGSAALKAIAVADGTVDMYPCLYRTGEWDTCAPQIIVEEAGGSVLRYDGSGEGGMSEVAALLRASGEKDAKTAPAGTASAGGGGAGAAVGEGKRSESPASSTPDSRLVLSYNKADLSSPRCMFLGRCSAD